MINLSVQPIVIMIFLSCQMLIGLPCADAQAADVSRRSPPTPMAVPANASAISGVQPTSGQGVRLVRAIESDPVGTGLWDEGSQMQTCCDEPAFINFGSGWNTPWQCGAECYWIRGEYLNWDMSGADIPALVSTSTAGVLREDAGLLGNASTTVLLGDRPLTDGEQSGGRGTLGFWIDDCHQLGLEYTFTGLGKLSESFAATTDQFPILARPFFNVDSGVEDARLLGFPGELSGQIQVDYSTEYQAHDLILLHPLTENQRTHIFLVGGYRSADLDDELSIRDSSLSLSGVTSGTMIATSERFQSTNEFQGFEIGLLTKTQLSCRWRLDVDAKVAFGETDHVTRTFAQSVTTNSAGQSASANNGLLIQQSNLGTFAFDSESVMHDFSVTLRRHLRWGVSCSLGYSIHRWTNVARAGGQVDRFINPTQIPPGTLSGDARPSRRDATDDFIAQGITAGFEWVW